MSPAKLMILRPFFRAVLIWTIVSTATWSIAGEKLNSTSDDSVSDNEFFVVGHRGAAGLAPENTLAAFKRACESRVDAIELDVLLSADGKWLRRPGPAVKDLMSQLKTYDVGRLKPGTRYSRRYPDQQPADGERIPTLAESIALIKTSCGDATQIWIEIKTNPEKPWITPSPETIADAVVLLLNELNFTERARILAFDWRVLSHLKKTAPDIPLVYLTHDGVRFNTVKPGRPGASPWLAGLDIDDFNGSVPQAVKAAGGRHWAPHYKSLTITRLAEAYRLGLKVYVWTVDSRTEMIRLLEMGVNGIITNRPDILRSVVGLAR